jgi:hypothetical protein
VKTEGRIGTGGTAISVMMSFSGLSPRFSNSQSCRMLKYKKTNQTNLLSDKNWYSTERKITNTHVRWQTTCTSSVILLKRERTVWGSNRWAEGTEIFSFLCDKADRTSSILPSNVLLQSWTIVKLSPFGPFFATPVHSTQTEGKAQKASRTGVHQLLGSIVKY